MSKSKVVGLMVIVLAAAAIAGCARSSHSGSVYDDLASQAEAVARGAAVGDEVIPGANQDVIDMDQFCRSNKQPDICFQLTNRTRTFSAPFVLGGVAPLTVNRFCSGDGYFPELGGHTGSGCWGGIQYYDYYRPYEARGRLTPNPFTDVGAMLFRSNGPWSGTEITLEITGATAPFRNAGTPAKAYFDTPFVGSNGGHGTDGTYIESSIDPNSYTGKANSSRPVFMLRTRPVRIRIQNSAPNVQLKLDGTESTDRFLMDPAARSANASLIPARANSFLGGYRAITGRSNLTLNYRIADAAGSTMSSPTCPGCGARVTITFEYDAGSATPSTGSTCTVTNISAMATYNCRDARVDGDDELLTYTVNFREGEQ